VAKPKHIELNDGAVVIPILYEDRSVLALDKPAGWMLAPDSWDHTGRNLQLALQSSLNARDFWASSRSLKFLRFIHRLDAETTGITLFAKNPGALRAFSRLFEERRVEKAYLAVVCGIPKQPEWTCRLAIAPDPAAKGRMLTISEELFAKRNHTLSRTASAEDGSDDETDTRSSRDEPKDAETHFTVLQTVGATALIEARPTTGRTHQIRVHLAAAGHPVVGDPVYGTAVAALSKGRQRLALRAFRLAYPDPFQRRTIRIEAPAEEFLREYKFESARQLLLRKPNPAPNVAS
jgi:23S rRNA pseudouridine1911/1915/1917 synthase